MANTFELIEAKTLASATSAVTFSVIPTTFTDLVVKVSARSNTAEDNGWFRLTFNGSSSGYSYKRLYGAGSGTPGADSSADVSPVSGNGTTSTFGNAEIYIPNYLSSSNKSASIDGVGENNATKAYSALSALLWANTAAITSVTITSPYSTFETSSTFYLYGVKNA
jgi:hypothetical protein